MAVFWSSTAINTNRLKLLTSANEQAGWRLFSINVRESKKWPGPFTTAPATPAGGFDTNDRLTVEDYVGTVSTGTAVRPDTRNHSGEEGVVVGNIKDSAGNFQSLTLHDVDMDGANVIGVQEWDADTGTEVADPDSFNLLCVGRYCFGSRDDWTDLDDDLFNRYVTQGDTSADDSGRLWAAKVSSAGALIWPDSGEGIANVQQTPATTGSYELDLVPTCDTNGRAIPVATVERVSGAATAVTCWVSAVAVATPHYTIRTATAAAVANSQIHVILLGYSATLPWAGGTSATASNMNMRTIAGNGNTAGVRYSGGVGETDNTLDSAFFDNNIASVAYTNPGSFAFVYTNAYASEPTVVACPIETAATDPLGCTVVASSTTGCTIEIYDTVANALYNSATIKCAVIAAGVI